MQEDSTLEDKDMRQGSFKLSRPMSGLRQRRASVLVMPLAAVFALVVIVGSFIFFSNFAHNNAMPTSIISSVSARGLYGSRNNIIYRLDNQTHKVLWKHTFASDESVENGLPGRNQKPFAVGSLLYVETQNTGAQAPGKQYLYALNVTNGAVLWRQASAQAFANNTAIYTLVESTKADTSTLTAFDLHTGKQLWQHQYPIVGTGEPSRGTDDTAGFRLVTVTDQVLYAVVAYHQNGQNFFARYALSPTDGSILWHTTEALSGSIQVTARIVNGVIYTAEYNLKPVSPHKGAHEMYIVEIPQVRVSAYDVATGALHWQTAEMVDEQPHGNFTLNISDTMLYFQTFNNAWPATAATPNHILTLHALRLTDGKSGWQYQLKNEIGDMSDSVLAGTSLYFETIKVTTIGGTQTSQMYVVALNAQTGNQHWVTTVQWLNGTEKTPTPVKPTGNAPIGDNPRGISGEITPVVSGNTVYLSMPGQRIYAIRASDGRILAQFWVDKTDQTTMFDSLTLFVVS